MDSDNHEPGDKVQIRNDSYKGLRGIVQKATDSELYVQLTDGSIVQVSANLLTNYSRAARRAWQKMPKRAGRPKSPILRKKMVSMRLDQDLWEMLGYLVEIGVIPSREQAINEWIREHINSFSHLDTATTQSSVEGGIDGPAETS